MTSAHDKAVEAAENAYDNIAVRDDILHVAWPCGIEAAIEAYRQFLVQSVDVEELALVLRQALQYFDKQILTHYQSEHCVKAIISALLYAWHWGIAECLCMRS